MLSSKLDDSKDSMDFLPGTPFNVTQNTSHEWKVGTNLLNFSCFFQMEAFFDFSTANNATFSQAWDCVGFFTVPIWVSLLTTLLLVIILSIGLYMLSDIKTMDRFDDPKGQPIMVYTAAE